MVRHKTLRKKYYKNRENTIVKTAPRRRATKRKRVEHRVAGMLRRAFSFTRRQRDERPPSAGPSTARASLVGNILGDSNRPRNSVDLPGSSRTHRNEPAISGELRIFHNILLIREGAAALEDIYKINPKIYNIPKTTEDPFPLEEDIYQTNYLNKIKPIIERLPDTDHFADERTVLMSMRTLHRAIGRFIRKIIEKTALMQHGSTPFLSQHPLMRSIRLLKEMMVHSHADQFFTQHI
jgi:hypothetical protein